MNRSQLIVALVCCSLALSCAHQNSPPERTTQATPSPIAVPQAAGGLATTEPGESLEAEFKGTDGITEKKQLNLKPVILKDVRTGVHGNFDRIVFEFGGDVVPGYRIEYIEKPARDCGAGEVVPISTNGILLIAIQPAQAHSESGVPTIANRQQAPGLPVLKEMKLICDFEADVQWLLGVASTNNYRVLELSNPARLVIDVGHKPPAV